MRIFGWMPGYLLLVAMCGCGVCWAQDTSQAGPDDGGMLLKTAPLPDEHGVYGVVDGILPPAIVDGIEPIFPPAQTVELEHPMICLVGAVIGIDGMPSQVSVTRGCSEVFTASAVDAVTRSKYRAGTLNGKPVPVLVHVRVTYRDPLFANAPRLALRYRENPLGWTPPVKKYDIPPRVTYQVEAEFSEQARKARKEGVVLVSLVVDENGNPTDVQVVRGVGLGLDEQAIKSVSQYRFKPAMKDGQPVAAQINVEVSFTFYGHRRN